MIWRILTNLFGAKSICNPNGNDRARYLINAGADVDLMVNEDKIKSTGVLSTLVIGGIAVTPLQLAAKEGKTSLVRELLMHGANVRIWNSVS